MTHGNAAKNAHEVVLRELLDRGKPGSVVDAPCGGGGLARRFASAGFGVIGLDIERPQGMAGFDFRAADLNAPLPVATGEADNVVSVEGIEHLERPFAFVRECNRILRDGGLLIMTTPNISSLRSRWRWFMSGFHHKCKYALDETRPSFSHHINMISFPELRYMLHTNGFRMEAVTTNRIKAVSWLYAPLVPFVYVFSRLVIAKARKSEINRLLSREVLHQMTSPALLFGELMIVAARKSGSAGS